MPKRIGPTYASDTDVLYNSFMHTDARLQAILCQVLSFLGFRHTEPYPQWTEGGNWQAYINMTSPGRTVNIYAEALDMPYKARDSVFIYALDYVDRFLGVDIIDMNHSVYL
ncbi:hypothetical protein BS78_K043400, partial [Paspalum vaginatum]